MKEIYEKLISILQQYTEKEITLDQILKTTTSVNDLGISSIRRMDIIIDIEEFYNIEFNENEMRKLGTVNELAHLIQKKLTNQ